MSVLQDLKLSIRQLRRRPGFTAIAALTLAIGMGVNTVAFTIVNGLLFKGPSLRSPEGMGRVTTTPGGDESGYASLLEYERFAEGTRGALELAAEGRLTLAWRHENLTDTAWVLFVSPNYFSMLDARLLSGRIDLKGDGDSPTGVIGERFWRRSLNGAPLDGLTLRLNDTAVSVSGVLPESFRGPGGLYSPDVWLPLDRLRLFHTSPTLQKPEARWLFLFGRLAPAVSVAEIQGRLESAAAAMAHDWPDSHRQRGVRFSLFTEGNSELRGLSAAAAVAMAIIGLVLVRACFNVANLLLARAIERERDMAIRAAIGASPAQLARLAIVDGLVIAALAGAAALLLALWTQSLVGSFAIPIEQPQHIDLAPDRVVVLYVLLLIVVAGVLPGLWPAMAAVRADLLRILGSQGAGSSGGRPSALRRWLVGVQIAGSTVFLAIAALFAQSYGRLAVADLGFDADRLVAAEFSPSSHGYDMHRSKQYAEALLSRLRALPSVNDAALANRAPFFVGYDEQTAVSASGSACVAGTCPKFATLAVGAGYFRTLGIPLVAGREFRQPASRQEAIVNQPLARALWPDGRGFGETLRIGDQGEVVTVVGVTAKSHTRGLDREQPTLYVPLHDERFGGDLTIVARAAIPPALLVRPLADTARQLDPGVSMAAVKTMRDRMSVQLWPFRTITWLFSICGSLALVLATAGLAAVVSHAVTRRYREFGIRLSLGAGSWNLVSEVLRGSARLLVPGVVVGTVLATGGAYLGRSIFVGVNVLNPAAYLAVALLELAIVAAASIGPALRASRVDPLTALRAE